MRGLSGPGVQIKATAAAHTPSSGGCLRMGVAELQNGNGVLRAKASILSRWSDEMAQSGPTPCLAAAFDIPKPTPFWCPSNKHGRVGQC